MNSTVNIFADDTKLFRSVTTDEEHVVLQSDLDMLADWSETWQLKFNASKCKVLHIGQHDTNYQACQQEREKKSENFLCSLSRLAKPGEHVS